MRDPGVLIHAALGLCAGLLIAVLLDPPWSYVGYSIVTLFGIGREAGQAYQHKSITAHKVMEGAAWLTVWAGVLLDYYVEGLL